MRNNFYRDEHLECDECGKAYTKHNGRPMYQGAVYDDVRAAIYLVVSSMRAEQNNVGYISNQKRTDYYMNQPEIIRLYFPETHVYNQLCEAIDRPNKKRCGLRPHQDNLHEFTEDMK